MRAALPAGDRGSASLVVVGLAAVLALLGMVLVAAGAAGTSRHRAASTADLGALAAAARALEGSGAACGAATTVAQAAGAEVLRCALVGEVAQVEVQVRPEGPLGRLGAARAQARAGPADLHPTAGQVPGAGTHPSAPLGPGGGR